MNLLYNRAELPSDQKVYIDSPLAIAATEIFKRSSEFYDNETNLLMEGADPSFYLTSIILAPVRILLN